jgi:hypothetical protein
LLRKQLTNVTAAVVLVQIRHRLGPTSHIRIPAGNIRRDGVARKDPHADTIRLESHSVHPAATVVETVAERLVGTFDFATIDCVQGAVVLEERTGLIGGIEDAGLGFIRVQRDDIERV